MVRILLAISCLLILPSCRSARSSTPPTAQTTADGVSLRAHTGGGQLALTDGSRWAIQPAGQSASLHWRVGDPLRVDRSGHPAYPFLIISAPQGTAALARLATP